MATVAVAEASSGAARQSLDGWLNSPAIARDLLTPKYSRGLVTS